MTDREQHLVNKKKLIEPTTISLSRDIMTESSTPQKSILLRFAFAIVLLCFGLTGYAQNCNDQISNGEYDNGLTDWALYLNDTTVAATMSVDNGSELSGTNSNEIVITSVSDKEWHVQLAQESRTLEDNKEYQLSFSAKSSAARDISVALDSGWPDYTTYIYHVASLTTSSQVFTFPFTADTTQIGGVRLLFNLSETTGTVWIDNVQLEEVCTEICDNNIDDDGDGLIDEYDPDCGQICTNDCPTSYSFDWYDGTNGNQWAITNGESTLSRVYPISGPQGTYNVTVTLDNPDGQNIDQSNCGTAGNHFYTATCNDPLAGFDCDGDATTVDGQFSYGCNYLTFGITSNDSDESTSITYSFEYPSQICGLEIGDIDYQGTNSGIVDSWQDEIDIVADSMGVPVAINASVGSQVDVTNNNTANLNLASVYSADAFGGNLDPNDPEGTATITTLSKVTSITFTYSNGPADEGQSDDHAIRLTGFDFCPTPQEICDNGIDDDGDGLTDCEDPNCSGTATLSNVVVSSCIDHPLRDVATVSVDVNWPNDPAPTENFRVTLGDNVEIIDVLGGASSPYTVVFTMPADGSVQSIVLESESSSASSDSNPLVSALEFNAFVRHDATVRSVDSEGPVAVGGDLTFDSPGNFIVGAQDAGILHHGSESNPSTLVVGGRVHYTSGLDLFVNSGGHLKIGDLTGTNLYDQDGPATVNLRASAGAYNDYPRIQVQTLQPASSVQSSSVIDFDAAFTSLIASATAMSTQVDNASITTSGAITMVPGQTNYVTLTAAQLTALTQFSTNIAPSPANPLIVNVSGQNITWTVPNFNASTQGWGSFITWNFYEATNVELITNSSVLGAVLAPLAHVTKNGGANIDGQVIADSYIHNTGEIHNRPYAGTTCPVTLAVTLPAACSTEEEIACDILYLCGLDKPYDGEPWDKGWIQYLDQVNGTATVDAILTKDEPGLGTYDVMNQNTFVNVDLTAYDLIVISGTTEAHISSDLVADLRDAQAAVILGNSFLIDDMGMGATDGGESFGTSAYIDNSTSVEILDYDNGPGASPTIFTTGAYAANGIASLWAGAGDANAGTNGIIFTYDATDVLPGVAAQHGLRQYLGLHFNGIYANTENGGALPSPASSWFVPEHDLTLEGKALLEEALVIAGAGCFIDCPNPPTATVTVPAPLSCDDTSTTLTAGPAGMDYLWSNNQTTRSITVSTPGLYSVTITDANGCKDDIIGFVVDNTQGPTVELSDVSTCGQPVDLLPTTCENYGDFRAQRNLQRNGWNNTIGAPGAALVGDGEFCFTVDSLKDGTIQMIGLNDNPTNSRSFTDMEYAFYVWARENTSTYRLYIRENGTQKAFPINSSTSYVGSEFCIRRTGTTVEYLQDGVVLYTSLVASTTDLQIDNSFHSTTAAGTWFGGYSHFSNISLCGELDAFSYAWSTGATTESISAGVGSYSVTVTDSKGCSSIENVVVSSQVSDLSAAIDFDGSVCLTAGSTLTAIPSGGTPAYTYSWSGPNSFTGSTETVSITENGNYFLTITDAGGCEASTSGFVFQEYDPVIVNLQTDVCEGESVELAVNSSSAVSYQWSSNAAGSTSSSVTVFPSSPSSTYSVTVTNDQGCTAVPQVTITASPKPTLDAGADQSSCDGEQVTLGASTTSTGAGPYQYSWSSGLGTGATKTVTASTSTTSDTEQKYYVTITDANGCTEIDSVSVVSLSTPDVSITHVDESCGQDNGQITVSFSDHTNRSTIRLSIDGGTTYTDVADSAGSYTFANLEPGNYTVFSQWTASGNSNPLFNGTCTVDNGVIVIDAEDVPAVDITGSDLICVGGNTTLSPSFGGTWSSSNTSVATVTNSGLVTGVGIGSATFTFTSNANCVSEPTAAVTVGEDVSISITGDNTLCEGDNTTLSSSGSGGSWTSSDTGVATINASGVVTTISAGSTTITYVQGAGSCGQDAQFPITVYSTPTVAYSGPSTICEGSTTSVTPATGGTWTSSNTSVAVITNSGIITGIAPGTATFTYTQGGTDCTSAATAQLTVVDGVEAAIDFNGSNCLQDSSQLTAIPTGGYAPYQYSWTGPNGFAENTETIDITENGNYFLTITDDLGCTASTSGFVYEQFQAFVINLNTDVCEGESVNISASASAGVSYQWSANAGSSTSQSVTVMPSPPSTTYTVTITNNVGCTAEAFATINVDAVDPISISGDSDICVGGTTTLAPSTGGVWTTPNTDVVNVSFSGVVTGIAPGTAYITYTDASTGCESTESLEITVQDEINPVFTGPTSICIGSTTSLTPATGGVWSSSNTNVATVTNTGIVTAVGSGAATFTYTDSNTGCSGTTSQTLIVNGRPNVSLASTAPLCIGELTSASPSSGGTWSSSNPAIASITNGGVITAVSPGSVTFTFVNTTSGCTSNPTNSLTIADRPVVNISGDDNICVDETTTLSPSTGGTWTSENPNVATVNNFGVVTGVQTGTVRFRYTSAATGCESEFSGIVTVEPSPTAMILGDGNICEGGTAQLSPSTGGTWVSSNPAIASVTNTGEVSGLQPGSVSFTFTDSTTGCTATTPGSITVFGQPDIQLDGPSSICQGTSTTFQPSTGGVWSSSNSGIATISLSGVATGISPGTVTFTYTETASGCPSDESVTIEVEPAPAVSITGSNGICAGETTTLSPSTGGAWVSTNPAVATVTNSGTVTGVSQGLARFTFISDAGCSSNPTSPVIVYSNPVLISTDGTSTCIGNDINILPSSGGTWQSSDTGIATITNTGVISGIAAGTVVFTYTETATGCSTASEPFTITDVPVTNVSGASDICVGEITNLAPTVGGVWTSSNPAVATIENNGTVVGLQAGTATFIFTDISSGCESAPSDPVTVLPAPAASIVGSDQACIGETLTLSPSTGGSWTSTNPTVATVSNSGVVTAISQGSARFRFTSATSGCTSELTDPITVNEAPTVIIAGSPFVCIGGTTSVTPSTGGTWTSNDTNIATITNSGIVTGVTSGTTSITYTDASTGCTSAPLEVTVIVPVEVQIVGDTDICIGSATTLSPTVGGTWVSDNPMIATVTNSGVVRGVAPGSVTFTFLESTTGCTIGNVTDPISVSACTNPDFNVTESGLTITSSIATNDNVPAGTIYQNTVTTVSKPTASLPVLTINPDGTYSFTATVPGKYVYAVPVCMPPLEYGCKSSLLEITVLDNIFSVDNIVTNPEMVSTTADADVTLPGAPVVIQTIANDHCVNVGTCTIDPATVTVTDSPSHGSTTVAADGTITYTPEAGFVGIDTLEYQICSASDATDCQTSSQIVTVGHTSASNSLYAADDFDWTMRGIAMTGNVSINDGDPEGDQTTVTAMGTASNPVAVNGGTYFIDADGNYTFTPDDSFTGYTEIIYTICDDNTIQACTDATLHILVFDDLTLSLSLYLEGALMRNGDETAPDGKPLMRDDLRVSPFDGKNYIPLSDPYTYATGSFDFTNKYAHVGPGLLTENHDILDSMAVFSVTGHDAIVDWVFVEIRDKDNMVNTIATRSGLLQRDGDVVDLDGVSPLRFKGVNADSFYVVVNHKSHLGAMSLLVPNGEPVDFRELTTEVFDYGTTYNASLDYTDFATNQNVKVGYRALWAGDFDSNGKIKYDNPNDDQNILFFTVTTLPGNPFANSNYDFGYGYYSCDYDMNSKVKYDNPNDDNNMLFFQIIACSLNQVGLSNFNFFIEQVPR